MLQLDHFWGSSSLFAIADFTHFSHYFKFSLRRFGDKQHEGKFNTVMRHNTSFGEFEMKKAAK